MLKNRICRICQKPIIYEIGNGAGRTGYCSENCSKRAAVIRNTSNRKACNLQARLGLKGGTIGAINESVVAVDLIKKGWNVYTAFEATHPFDILAVQDNVTLRIEVKTETVLPSGRTVVAMKKSQVSKHDILAKVRNLSEVTYHPELP